jgi:hypothetical protein
VIKGRNYLLVDVKGTFVLIADVLITNQNSCQTNSVIIESQTGNCCALVFAPYLIILKRVRILKYFYLFR